MYIITNREIREGRDGLDIFGSTPSAKGPNELRLSRVTTRGMGFQVEILDDKLTQLRVEELAAQYDLDIALDQNWFASLEVACEIFSDARRKKKDVLFYVHGYNNDIEDVVKSMQEMERRYPVLVVGFSWPANGGGAISGTAAYLSDKRDARASSDALNRLIEKLHYYHQLLSKSVQDKLMVKASRKHGENYQAVQQYYSELLSKACRTRINLMCHSMGNYLLKYALMPSDAGARRLVFDNVSLIAADANNRNHARWVENIQTKGRVYIVLNEDDFALKWSRRKPGKEQLVRLGHYRKRLVAENASYIDVTNVSHVKNSHSYFIGIPVEKNTKLREFFSEILSGNRVEKQLKYYVDENVYEV